MTRTQTLAIVDHDCRAAIRYEATIREVDHDLQAQFVARHRAELESWALQAAASRTPAP